MRGLILAGATAAAVAVGSIGGGAWLLSHPRRVQQVIDWSLRDTGVAVRLADATLLPGPQPWTWRLALEGIAVVPERAEQARLSLDKIQFRVPSLLALLTGRIRLGAVEVDGLHIEIPTRRAQTAQDETGAAEDAGPVRLGPAILAESLEIRDASVHAPADDPLPSLDIRGLSGRIDHFGLRVGQGPLRGLGSLSATTYRSGPVRVDDMHAKVVRLHGEGLDVHEVDFQLAGGRGTGKVDIDQGELRPRIQVVADVEGVDLQLLVRQAIGVDAPVGGRLDGTITVRAGGRLPRGGAVTRAQISLEDGRVDVADRLGPGARAVLKLLPWVTMKRGELLLGPTEGRLELRQGRVVIEQLVHRHKRDLEMWGTVSRSALDLTVHLHKRSSDKAGTGLIIHGAPGALELRRAKKTELER